MNWDTQIYLGANGKTIGPMTMSQLRNVHDEVDLFKAAESEDAFILFDADEGWVELPDALRRIQSAMPDFFAQTGITASQAWSPPPVPSARATASARFCCPNCGAEAIARARVIYEQGTVRGATSSGEYYYDPMAQTVRSTGNQEYTSSTDLAARLAPPEGMPMGCLWPLFLVGAVPGLLLGPIGAGVLGVLVLFGVPIAYNVLVRRPEMAKYERLWYCFRCGSAWYR